MSHFTVAVFTKDPEQVESLLAPYDEGLHVAPYIKYTRQQAIEYVRSNFESMKDASDDECYEWLAEDFRGDGMIDTFGNLLSAYNPNSKWDWWTEGGRWDDYLKLLDGSRSNSALCSEVDFSYNKHVYDDAIRFWEEYVEGNIGDVDKHQDEDFDFRRMYKPEYYIDRFKTKEAYAIDLASVKTYAFVDATGVWHQTGEMGWWGIDNATNESRSTYNELFDQYVEYAKQNNLYITVVDCHI